MFIHFGGVGLRQTPIYIIRSPGSEGILDHTSSLQIHASPTFNYYGNPIELALYSDGYHST